MDDAPLAEAPKITRWKAAKIAEIREVSRIDWRRIYSSASYVWRTFASMVLCRTVSRRVGCLNARLTRLQVCLQA